MKAWTTSIILGVTVGVAGCELEPPDSAGEGLSASAGEQSTGDEPVAGTTGSTDETFGGSSSGDTTGSSPEPEPETTSGPSIDEEGSSSSGWWDDSSSGGWGSSSGGLFDACEGYADTASCEAEPGCIWIGAGGEGVCIEDFGGGAGDFCSFVDVEVCDLLDDCALDEEAGLCGPA